MAIGADFNAQHVALDCRACRESISASAMYGYSVIVGVDTGFHVSPICRVRSAQLKLTTAASLGHEAIADYTGKGRKRKTSGQIRETTGHRIKTDVGVG